MAQLYYFFSSVPGDRRKYNAQDLAEYMGDVLSTGLHHIDNVPGLAVTVEEGTLNVVVDKGKAIMEGHRYFNTTPFTMTHRVPESSADRIDRIVLRLDLRKDERNILLHIKEGNPSSDPTPPELQRDDFIHELSLAQVRLRANTSSIESSDVKDERLDNDVCGLVFSLISKQTLADIAYGQYKIIATAGQTEVDIPMINFDKFRDGLLVFVNKEKAEYDSYFIKDQKTVVFNNPLNEGDVIEFQVTQAVTDPKDDYDLLASNVEVTDGMGIFKSNNVEQSLYEVMTQNDYFDIVKEDLNPNDNVFRTVKFLKGDTLIKKHELLDDDKDGLYEKQIITFYNLDGSVQYVRTFEILFDYNGFQTGEKEVFD